MTVESDIERFKVPVTNFYVAAFETFPGEPEKQQGLLKTLGKSEDYEAILTRVDSLRFSPPEQMLELMHNLYYVGGLRGVLIDSGLDDVERMNFMNNLAGVKVIVGLNAQEDGQT